VTGADLSDKKPDGAATGTPLKQEQSPPTKDKESDPVAAVEDTKDPMDKDLPLQPQKSTTL
jgi:hypothetical protein